MRRPSALHAHQGEIGTRYVACRRADAGRSRPIPATWSKVHALQDAIKVEQPGGPGKFEVPNWDPASQKKVRDALIVLATTLTDTSKAFGTKDEVDPVQRLIGAATAWGGNPERTPSISTSRRTRMTARRSTSSTSRTCRSTASGRSASTTRRAIIEKNDLNAYSLNNVTAKKSADGSVTIQFGGCDGKIPNCLPIMPGWNYMVRLYRPRAEILNGTWKFPEAQAVRIEGGWIGVGLGRDAQESAMTAIQNGGFDWLWWLCLVIVIGLVIAGIWAVFTLGGLPGRVAAARGHPQAAAIGVCGWLGLITSCCGRSRSSGPTLRLRAARTSRLARSRRAACGLRGPPSASAAIEAGLGTTSPRRIA